MAEVQIVDLNPKLSPDGTELLEIQENGAGGPGTSFYTPLSNLIGPEGPEGPQGEQGEIGPAGPEGPEGPAGADGDDGADGTSATATAGTTTTLPEGSDASVTNVGTVNDAIFAFGIPRGDKGEKGDEGDAGSGYNLIGSETVANLNATNAADHNVGDAYLMIDAGTVQPTGASQGTPVNADELIVWSASDYFVNYGTQEGVEGPPGDDGTSATVAVGTTVTLSPGVDATVVNSGTVNDAIFNFGIPEGLAGADGAKGDKGDQGDQGIQGPQGATGGDGADGSDGAAATIAAGTTTTLTPGEDATVANSGTASAAVFDFGIPAGVPGSDGSQGEKGDTGDTGPAGTAATLTVGDTTTLAPGVSASVVNSGTTSAAVFDFGIPEGVAGADGSDGAPGQDGADGADGAPGADGKTYYSGAVLPDPAGYTDGDLFMVIS